MTEAPALFIEIVILAVLILINGMLSMAEISLISVSKSNLETLSKQGDKGATAALDISKRPSELLSTVQVGMTLIAFTAGVYSGTTFVEQLAPVFLQLGLSTRYAQLLASVLVVLVITLVTVVFGELVPKKIALHAPNSVALWVGKPVVFLARLFQPVVFALAKTTDVICQLLGLNNLGDASASRQEEIKTLLQESAKIGAFDATEQRMVQGVFAFNEARISSFMTPRPEVIWLDIDDPAEKNRKKIINARHSHFPVVKGSLDNVVGVIHVKDILSRQLLGEPFDLTLYLEQALFLPEKADASRSVELFRNSATHFAFVVDEYGNIQGVLTLTDILRAIVGDFADTMDDKSTTILKRQDGSWVVDGLVTVQELRERLQLPKLRGEDSGNFHTVAGFVLSELGKIPSTTDWFVADDVRYEVIDMDGNRVDKVLINFISKQP
ncbi:MAG: hemolysin family protein [Silvanigrellaceae bacterium]